MEFKDLTFVRLLAPSLIPRNLLGKVPCARWDVEDFIRYADDMARAWTTRFYAMMSPNNEIKGFIWFTYNPLTQEIMVDTYAVDDEYTKPPGAATEGTLEFLRGWISRKKEAGVAIKDKILWATTKPEGFEALGAERTGHVVMEI